MQDVFLDFQWPVAPAYEWQDWLDNHGRPAVVSAVRLARLESPSAVVGPGLERIWGQLDRERTKLATESGPVLAPLDASNPRHYSPLRQNPALFREFAKLDCRNRAAILAFAREHGLLGLETQHQSVAIRTRSGRLKRWHSAYGESHFAWAREICYMREAERLTEHRAFKHLRRLKWLCDRHLRHVAARLSFDAAGEPQLAIEPVSLIAAMWLQFALAITGGKRFVACKYCRRLFEISTDQTGSRTDRTFCTVACKTKDYRQRKRTAVRLATSGASPAEISGRIETNKATIEKWLAAFRLREKGKK